MTPEEIDKSLSEYMADLIGAVRDKARKQAIEEAAKIVESIEPRKGYLNQWEWPPPQEIATAIRALAQKD